MYKNYTAISHIQSIFYTVNLCINQVKKLKIKKEAAFWDSPIFYWNKFILDDIHRQNKKGCLEREDHCEPWPVRYNSNTQGNGWQEKQEPV